MGDTLPYGHLINTVYGHLVIMASLFCLEKMPIHVLIGKPHKSGKSVNMANSHILKFQLVQSCVTLLIQPPCYYSQIFMAL